MKSVPNDSFSGDDVNLKGRNFGAAQKSLETKARAKELLIIQNPYIDLTTSTKAAITQAKNNGAKIIIITNMDKTNDMKLVGAAWPKNRQWLASMGATVYEHIGPNDEYKAAVKREEKLKLAKKLTKGDPKYKDSFSNPDKWKLRNIENLKDAENSVHNKIISVDGYNYPGIAENGCVNKDFRSEFINTETATTYTGDEIARLHHDRANEKIKSGKYLKTVDGGKVLIIPESYGPCKKILVEFLTKLL